MRKPLLTIAALRRDYATGVATPAAVVSGIFARIGGDLSPIWISLADRDDALARARSVDLSLPLGGVPFAVKDNIDVEGMATTAGCPSFAYRAARSAPVVERLLAAGAILIGKTNLDQFATGLVGTRSPYGACSSVFDDRYISGGSSSGSAVAVASGLCAFALGTDTAGSGRVPAAFNDLVGVKPTRGLLSTSGVVPACRSLDCVSIFATTAADAAAIWEVAQGLDAADPFSRTVLPGGNAAPWLSGAFRFGVPAAADLEFFGDLESPAMYELAAQRLELLGGTRTVIDFAPFRNAAALLYFGPWVSERTAAVGDFVARGSADIDPIVGRIIRSGDAYSAVDAFRGLYQLADLKQVAAAEWAAMDVLLLPTAPTIYTKAAIAEDPVVLNARLGHYTNFVNLMDLAAIAVPAGFRPDGLPFGISLIGPAFSDAALLRTAARFLGEIDVETHTAPGCVQVAVVGAHLTGQPLNHELTSRGARLARSSRTSVEYQLFALTGTTPPKPGLVRTPGHVGPGIEVEIWSVPEDRFGGFVAGVPPPLGIGRVQIEGGEWVSGFICEPVGLAAAEEITSFGGWRAYLRSDRNRGVNKAVSGPLAP
jgi:allophanate hydrolase